MRGNGAVIECCCPHGHMAHCINSEHEHSHEGSTSRMDFSKLAQDTGHVLICVVFYFLLILMVFSTMIVLSQK